MKTSPAAAAARRIRSAITRTKTAARGRVSVSSSDYHTEITVDLRGMPDVERDLVRDAIDDEDDRGLFTWDVIG